MNSPESLHWRLRPRALAPWDLVLLVVFFSVGGLLLFWKQGVDANTARDEQRLLRALSIPLPAEQKPAPRPTLNAAGVRQWQEQKGLLDRDWPRLLAAIAPNRKSVKVLGLDVNPASGAVRITALSPTSAAANSYAAAIARNAAPLQKVRLLILDRRDDGVHFEVSAQWTP